MPLLQILSGPHLGASRHDHVCSHDRWLFKRQGGGAEGEGEVAGRLLGCEPRARAI